MVVRRVVQHHANGFLLQTRSVSMPGLKISLTPRNPAVYISASRPPVDHPTGDFPMVLRKHLVSARLSAIRKPLSERIVELEFTTVLPARELETVVLVAELFPNAPNLLLLDRERRILSSFSPLQPQRGLAEYEEYRYPATGKTDLAAAIGFGQSLATEETGETPETADTSGAGNDTDVHVPEDIGDAGWFNEEEFLKDKRNWPIRNLAGVGPIFSNELVHRQTVSGRPLPEVLKSLMTMVAAPATTAWLYSERPVSVLLERGDMDSLYRSILSPIELESLDHSHSVDTFPGMLEATRFLCDALEDRTLLERMKTPQLRKLRNRKRRLAGQRKRLLDRRQRFEDTAGFRETAQVLVSSGVEMNQRRERVDVTDYTDGVPTPRTVELDPSRTVRENVDLMFKKNRKADRGIKMLEGQLLELEKAETRLAMEEAQIRSATNWNAWQTVTGGVQSSKSRGNGSRRTGSASAAKAARGRRRITLDGHEILIGRSSIDNDEITFRVAAADDFWLHVADYSGSHVIVRNPSKETDLDESLLERAAQLAAYHSQARNSHKVNVHYTRRKFVKKPRRAKPGLVVLHEFKSIAVEPRNWTGDES